MDLLAIAVIAFGGLYMLTGQTPFDLLQSLGMNGGGGGLIPQPLTPQQQAQAQAAQIAAQQTAQAEREAQTTRSGGGAVATVTAGAGTVAGIATGAGLAASSALLATGIGAAGALLVWGIVQKGWFRGGEEGVQVNPARDQFIQVWIDIYYPGAGSEKQFDAMATAMNEAFVNGIVAQNTIKRLYAAHTMDELQSACENFLAVLKAGPLAR